LWDNTVTAAMVMLLREAYYAHVRLSWLNMYMQFCTAHYIIVDEHFLIIIIIII
jgi:hypothetical protein